MFLTFPPFNTIRDIKVINVTIISMVMKSSQSRIETTLEIFMEVKISPPK
jgi:hypothetical protein